MRQYMHMEEISLEEDEVDLLEVIHAIRSGDEEASDKACMAYKWPVATLLHAKKAFGAEAVREMKMNTELADKELGEGWLDE